jgi:hypothetical protein
MRHSRINAGTYSQDRSHRQPLIVTLQQLLGLLSAIALIVFIPACATETSVSGNSTIQSTLLYAGFKAKPATTAEQKERLRSLPEREFTLVNQNGKKFYVWADKPNNTVYSGSEQAYRNYKQVRDAQQYRQEGAITWVATPTTPKVVVFNGWAPFDQW